MTYSSTGIGNSTGAFFERSTQGLSGLRAQAEKLQQSLSTENRLARSSDDPVAAARLRMLGRAEQLSEVDKSNADRAATDLSLTDTALSSFSDAIARAKELASRAASGVLSDSQRADIGQELTQLHGELVSLANSRDSSGHALFGGEATGEAYSLDAAGNAVYAGNGAAGEVSLGDGQSVGRGLTGPDFLNFNANGGPTNLLAVVKSLGEALQGGATDRAGAARDAMGTLDSALQSITTNQTIVGARLARIDLAADRRTDVSETRAAEQIEIGATDIPSTIAHLQQVMLVLDASQASFGKLAGISLFDQIR
jgi:flagellar hook-associated protein 3 FlgL